MKLGFSFRSSYVSKEKECFDKIALSPNGSDLYLRAFVIIRCSLNVFAFFLNKIQYLSQIDVSLNMVS